MYPSLMAIALALLAPMTALAQQSTDVYLEPTEPLEFALTVDVASGTEEIFCFQEPLGPIEVGSVQVSAKDTVAVVPIAIPDLVVRCTACNQFGCSEFSPNRGVVGVTQARKLDINGDGTVNVGDILGWSRAVTDWIMQSP